MPRQADRTVFTNLHSLITSQWLEIFQIQLEAVLQQANNFADLLTVSILAVRREAHDLAFVSILVVSDEIANHRVERPQRVWQKNAIENFDLISFTAGHHGRDEIPRTVITETRGLLPWRAVIGACDVGDMVFEVMFLKTRSFRVSMQRLSISERTSRRAASAAEAVSNLRFLLDSPPRIELFWTDWRRCPGPPQRDQYPECWRCDGLQARFNCERRKTRQNA